MNTEKKDDRVVVVASAKKQYSEAFDDPSLQQVLVAAKHLAMTVDKGLPRLSIKQAKAIGTLQQLMLCPTCNGGTELDNPNCIRICEGEAAHGPNNVTTDYKVGDRVMVNSIPATSAQEVADFTGGQSLRVDVVRKEGAPGHDLLLKRHDDAFCWVDYADVTKLTRVGWLDGHAGRDDYTVNINGLPLSPEPSLSVVNHSPTGFSWGYHGSGPAQLALAILLQYGSKQFALQWYQDFKREVVGQWRQGRGWSMHQDTVIAWIRRNAGADHVKKDEQPSDKIWWMMTPDACECGKPSHGATYHPGEGGCECGRTDKHDHCYCGGVIKYIEA